MLSPLSAPLARTSGATAMAASRLRGGAAASLLALFHAAASGLVLVLVFAAPQGEISYIPGTCGAVGWAPNRWDLPGINWMGGPFYSNPSFFGKPLSGKERETWD